MRLRRGRKKEAIIICQRACLFLSLGEIGGRFGALEQRKTPMAPPESLPRNKGIFPNIARLSSPVKTADLSVQSGDELNFKIEELLHVVSTI
ncbi:MAG: hypothetical protein P8173_09670 [Gammaproteobacteria bacterium]